MNGKTKAKFFALAAFFCFFSIPGPRLLEAENHNLPGDLTQLLRNEMGFSKREFRELNRGEVVTKSLKGSVKQENAVFGIVRINVPEEFFSKNYWNDGMNIETIGAERKGMFSNLPEMEDVRSLDIPPADLKELAKCRPGKCKVKATEDLIKDFRQLDKNAADFELRGTLLFRQTLVKYVQNYLKIGDAALAEYRDKEKPIRIADEFQGMLKGAPYLQTHAPGLHAYLAEFPNRQPVNARNVFYWMKEILGGEAKRPVMSINHAIFYQRPGLEGEMIVASKQLYATHYFEAALGLTIVVGDRAGSEPAFYLMHINRSRIDIMREIPGFMVRFYFKGTHNLFHKKMTTVKKNMEAAYRETHPVTANKN